MLQLASRQDENKTQDFMSRGISENKIIHQAVDLHIRIFPGIMYYNKQELEAN